MSALSDIFLVSASQITSNTIYIPSTRPSGAVPCTTSLKVGFSLIETEFPERTSIEAFPLLEGTATRFLHLPISRNGSERFLNCWLRSLDVTIPLIEKSFRVLTRT
jgi:hypothetical protein